MHKITQLAYYNLIDSGYIFLRNIRISGTCCVVEKFHILECLWLSAERLLNPQVSSDIKVKLCAFRGASVFPSIGRVIYKWVKSSFGQMIQFKIIFQVLKNSLLACLLMIIQFSLYLHIDLPNKHFFPVRVKSNRMGWSPSTLLRSLCQEQFLPRVKIQG